MTSVEYVSLILDKTANEVRFVGAGDEATYKLSTEFDWSAKHLISIEVDYRKLKITLDEPGIPARVQLLPDPVHGVCIFSENQPLAVSSFELTEGFEELFEDEISITSNGWNVTSDANYRVGAGELVVNTENIFELSKHRPLSSSEFAANFRVIGDDHVGEFGLLLRSEQKGDLRLSLDPSTATVFFNNEPIYKIPDEIALDEYHQLRMIKAGLEAFCYFDGALIRKIEVDDVETSAHAYANRVSVAIEMIRLTAI
jgi:hypothetical protein